jgi:MoaA/NifB/PqqE/SkfB family radical SAM enzyme
MRRAETRLAPRQKVVLHEQFARYLNGDFVNPINIEISPCGICNASCDFCFYAHGDLGGHRQVYLRESVLRDFLYQCWELRVKSITWTGGGEPTLYPGFGDMVAYADQLFLDQGLFTNALALPHYDPAKLAWIRITMTDRPYKAECIRPLRQARTLSFAFNWRGLEDEMYLIETLALCKDVGADYVQVRPALKFHGQTVDIPPPDFEHPLLHITDYKFEAARKPHGYQRCEAYHLNPFVWEDGNLDVCAYHRQTPGYTLGNIYHERLSDILAKASPSKPVLPTCQVCCKLHEMNEAIHEARELEDRNFP